MILDALNVITYGKNKSDNIYHMLTITGGLYSTTYSKCDVKSVITFAA